MKKYLGQVSLSVSIESDLNMENFNVRFDSLTGLLGAKLILIDNNGEIHKCIVEDMDIDWEEEE